VPLRSWDSCGERPQEVDLWDFCGAARRPSGSAPPTATQRSAPPVRSLNGAAECAELVPNRRHVLEVIRRGVPIGDPGPWHFCSPPVAGWSVPCPAPLAAADLHVVVVACAVPCHRCAVLGCPVREGAEPPRCPPRAMADRIARRPAGCARLRSSYLLHPTVAG
jgi:hypothetical protein